MKYPLSSFLYYNPPMCQRVQVFTSSISHANLKRQLLAAQNSKLELKTKLRERELLVERLERDRCWFADREGKGNEKLTKMKWFASHTLYK